MFLETLKCFGADKSSRRNHHCKIVFLDDTELVQDIQTSTLGQELLDVVNKHLNLLETAYFGLRFLDTTNQTHWLDPNKKVANQLKGTDPFTLYFAVKFYASDPCKLLEEITRYQFFLQVKQDVLQGRLPVPFDLAAELGALSVQSELGDYDPRRHQPGYVAEFCVAAHQTLELENHVAELHKTFIGQVPAVAELNFLEKVKWLDMYGVDLHPVLGEDNIEYFLGLTPSGVIVLRNKNKVGNYFWPRITKVYFKGKYFMLRVRDKSNDENTYGFELPSKQACKHLWKCCVEHHAFFRLTQVNTNSGGKVFSLSSRFRHSGRTERQVQSDLQQQNRLQPRVMRVASRRYSRRIGEPDGIDSSLKDDGNRENEKLETQSNLSIPEPLHLPSSIYRSSSLAVPDSPRSTRSAPWEDPRQRGLFSNSTNPSPRSVRSAGYKPSRHHHRASSIDSEDSVDGRRKRHQQRSRNHRSRRSSDNVGEVPSTQISQNRQTHSSSHSHRSGSRLRDNSGSESEGSQRHKHRSRKHRHGSNYELVNSEAQWQQVQNQQKVKQQAQIVGQAMQSSVIRNLSSSGGKRNSGYVNSGMESDSETSRLHRRRHRKHRSRSRSPSETHKKPPNELKKHFEYDLVDSNGMSVNQLRDIPYTKVETDSKIFKVKYSPNSKHRLPRSSTSSRHSKSNAHSVERNGNAPLRRTESEYNREADHDNYDDSCSPPPYSPNESTKATTVLTAITTTFSKSSPPSSIGSRTATDGRNEEYRRSFDLLASHYKARNSSPSSTSINGRSAHRNQFPFGDGEVLNAITTNHEHSDSGLGTDNNNGHLTSGGPETSESYRSSPNYSNTTMSSNASSNGVRQQYIVPPPSVKLTDNSLNGIHANQNHQTTTTSNSNHMRHCAPTTYQHQQSNYGQQLQSSSMSSTSTLPHMWNSRGPISRGQLGPKPTNTVMNRSLDRISLNHQQQQQQQRQNEYNVYNNEVNRSSLPASLPPLPSNHGNQQFVNYGPPLMAHTQVSNHSYPLPPPIPSVHQRPVTYTNATDGTQLFHLPPAGHAINGFDIVAHHPNYRMQMNHPHLDAGLVSSSHMSAYHTNRSFLPNYNGWSQYHNGGVDLSNRATISGDVDTAANKSINCSTTSTSNDGHLEHGHEMSTEL